MKRYEHIRYYEVIPTKDGIEKIELEVTDEVLEDFFKKGE